jgi:hypothetical protein
MTDSQNKSAGEILAELGTDAAKWSAGLNAQLLEQHGLVLGDEVQQTILEWFANAIESGRSAGVSSHIVIPAPEKALGAYDMGDAVEIKVLGAWTPGRVSSVDRISNRVHVDTDLGPKTIASTRGIRIRVAQ